MPESHAWRDRPAELLLVEDNPADVRLTVEALREARVPNRLHTVSDGVEALAFLRRAAGYRDVPRPDMILLDLNLPKKDGREVLAEVKNDPDLRQIPVVVLSTSSAERDILESYQLHANCYLTKPVGLEQFIALIRRFEGFWFGAASLPGENRR